MKSSEKWNHCNNWTTCSVCNAISAVQIKQKNFQETIYWKRRQKHSGDSTRDFLQPGRERRRERYKTIDLITEYNDFTWKWNQLAAFPPSSSVNRTWKAQFCGFPEYVNNWKYESFQSSCGFKIKVSKFSCSHSFNQNWNRNEWVKQTRKWKTESLNFRSICLRWRSRLNSTT